MLAFFQLAGGIHSVILHIFFFFFFLLHWVVNAACRLSSCDVFQLSSGAEH